MQVAFMSLWKSWGGVDTSEAHLVSTSY